MADNTPTADKQNDQQNGKPTDQQTDAGNDSQTTAQKAADLAHPQPAIHSDNEKSKLPERDDEGRNQSPADRPGKQPGEGEPSAS